MNKRLVHRLIFVAALLGTLLSLPASADRRYIRLTLLHTNDTHAHLRPFDYPRDLVVEGRRVRLDTYRDIGGIARRATLIRQIEAEPDAHVLVLDAGDLLDGTPFSAEFAGEADIAAMNAAGYDAMVTGNHEYSNPLPTLRKRIAEAQFPVLAANAMLISSGDPLARPFVIETLDGFRVAILGLTTSDSAAYPGARGALRFSDPVQVAREWVPRLRREADAVILLTHLGYEEDLRLAESVPGIDAILGGHSHTRLERPVLVRREEAPDDPFRLGGTVVAQDFQWGGDLGRVDLIFRKGPEHLPVEAPAPRPVWTLMSYDGRLIPVTGDLPEDKAVAAVVDRYWKKIAPKYGKVIGRAAGDFTGEAPYNLVSDAMMEATRSDFAVHNYGGVRSGLVEGPITVADMAAMLPFDNSLVRFVVSGAQLKQILLGKPAVGGIRYRIEGGRLVRAEIGGKPIENDRLYRGITQSYFAAQNLPKEIQKEDIGGNWRALVTEYIQARGSVRPDPENRAEGR